jgi:hypothetical protein
VVKPRWVFERFVVVSCSAGWVSINLELGRKLRESGGRSGGLAVPWVIPGSGLRIDNTHLFWLGSCCLRGHSSLDRKPVRDGWLCTAVVYPYVVFAMLTKWFSLTRLETRTKESNIYASIWVENPDAQ